VPVIRYCKGDKFKRISWAGYVSGVGKYRLFWSENVKEREHLERTGVGGKIILEKISKIV
jgi:hypothetical protein